MSAHFAVPHAPPPELIFKRMVRPWAMLRELWGARELVVALTERELRARYKQTKLGFTWSILTPVLLMVVFSVFLQQAVDVDTRGAPYALYSYIAILPWTFFSDSVSKGGVSITSNLSLVNKVYCPREVFPLASIAVAAVDTLIATTILGMLFAVYGVAPHGGIVWVPALLAIQVAFTLGVTMITSAIVVYFRDLRQVLPMVLQLGLFATPVAWEFFDTVPESMRPVYSAINPLVPVIDAYRKAILFGEQPPQGLLGIAAISATVVLIVGYLVFKRLETGFADVA